MKFTRVRFSLLSLFICITAIALLCGAVMLSDIGYRKHTASMVRKGATYGSIVQYGYRVDKLGFRGTKLDYLAITILPKGIGPAAFSIQGNAPVLDVNGQNVELPKSTQLHEFEANKLTKFKERVTYFQLLDFLARHPGSFRIEDMLQSIENENHSR